MIITITKSVYVDDKERDTVASIFFFFCLLSNLLCDANDRMSPHGLRIRSCERSPFGRVHLYDSKEKIKSLACCFTQTARVEKTPLVTKEIKRAITEERTTCFASTFGRCFGQRLAAAALFCLS